MSPYTLTILLAAFIATEKPPETKKELERLQGHWILVGGEVKGDEISEEDAKKEGCEFVIDGDRLTIKEHGRIKWEFKFTIAPSTKPPSIDLTYVQGRDKGKTNYAIYNVEGTSLKMCFSRKISPNKRSERPKEFKAK